MRWWLAAYAMTACGSVAGVAVDGASGTGGAAGNAGAQGLAGAPGMGGGSSAGLDALCAALAEAECSTALVTACALENAAACRAATAAACAAGTSDATFGRSAASFDAVAASSCLSAVKGAYADGAVDANELVAFERACDLAFSAKKPVGAACTVDVDCDVGNGLVCAAIAGARVCTLPGTKQNGETCTATSACAPELVCAPAGVCADGHDVGTACSAGDPCKPALRCVQSLCAPKAKTGGGCDAAAACAVGYCVHVPSDGDPAQRLCLSKLAYAAGSAICRAFGP